MTLTDGWHEHDTSWSLVRRGKVEARLLRSTNGWLRLYVRGQEQLPSAAVDDVEVAMRDLETAVSRLPVAP